MAIVARAGSPRNAYPCPALFRAFPGTGPGHVDASREFVERGCAWWAWPESRCVQDVQKA